MSIMKRALCMLLLLPVLMSVGACGIGGTEATQPSQQKSSVIMPKQDYVEPPFVDYSISNPDSFVDSIDQCTDPDKQYVLPDGYLYGIGKEFVPYASNQLLLATDKEGALFNGCGYHDGVRLESSVEIVESRFSFVTGFIPAQPEDIFYFSGNCFQLEHESAGAMYIVLYDMDRNVVGYTSMKHATDIFFDILGTNEDGYVTALQIRRWQAPKNLAYVRFTLIGSGAQQLISLNESLEAGEDVPVWVKLERYIPDAWYEEIRETVDTVNNIKLSDPATAIRFVFASDIHANPDSGTSHTENLGKVCAKVMQTCDIPFFAIGGDSCTQSSEHMPTMFRENMQVVLDQLDSIPQKNILLAVGSRDGATGSHETNGETLRYCYQLSNEERSTVFFDWQRETNEHKRFDGDGTYYYLDDSSTKTRYIVLNSSWAQWEGDADGLVSDLRHSIEYNPHFGSQQLTWFAAKALDMPPDYGAVIIAHAAPVAKDFEIFKGIVDAFSTRTTYSGSYEGSGEWLSTDISVNYHYADGEIIAVFQGYSHVDGVYDFFQKVPCINVTAAGDYWTATGGSNQDRIRGTASEFAADVVVIDREARKIYLTRLGAGEDRVIQY